MLKKLFELWFAERAFQKIAAAVNSSAGYRALVTGLEGSARNFLMAALAMNSTKPVLIITADVQEAEKIYSELQAFLPDQVKLLPARDSFMHPLIMSRSDDYLKMRLQLMHSFISGCRGLYVAPLDSLLTKNIAPASWRSNIIELVKGRHLELEKFTAHLVEIGYERVSLVEKSGQFSVRGNIIDLFSPAGHYPLRVELFDEYIESIRTYDPDTQRSREKIAGASIYPAVELVLSASLYSANKNKIQKSLQKSLENLRSKGEKEKAEHLEEEVNRHLEILAQPGGLNSLSNYLSFFYNAEASLLDYLPPGAPVFIAEPAAVVDRSERLQDDWLDCGSSLFKAGDLLPAGKDLLWRVEDLTCRYSGPQVGFALFSGTKGPFKPLENYNFEIKGMPYYHGQWTLFLNDYRSWQYKEYRIFLMSGSEERGRELLRLLSEQDPGRLEGELLNIEIVKGSIEEGFVAPGLNLAVLTEQNLLPRKKKKRIFKQNGRPKLSHYRELVVGDYVVHEQHGIGKYRGINTLEINGHKRDYIYLQYRGTDKLYIPADQAGSIEKYSAGNGPAPRLHSLGGSEWQRLKSKVSHSVEDLARDLLSLYAARQAVEGYSHGPDHPWQQEFEEEFPYEETPDQLQAIADVKTDLEKKHPMDRLICGDVGYGKTEVAMRAAFKVVTEGRQAAILVPTTILAQQHYRTFKERFKRFPVKIAQLSRFVGLEKQKELIKDLTSGKIDIVIGTHRLLSRDITFSDLGLLVIDEEQRFGVRQKEKIKRLRLEVDTLAMTATPIPRTLHLSLAGARDLSIIETPPEDRYPIQTYVLEYSDSLLQEAIQRELNRGGQVYVLFNRVDRINNFANRIKTLLPHASVAVGHGQLPEAVLEKIMIAFQEGGYQVLVSTTIIEAGLDIPNVNTIIICEADKFGLAQLYQIRGRVGRSDRLAYAYLTYLKNKVISEPAQKRLRAIKEFTELGSGFKIALRDLEIRGAGNILGAEQHGFIASVGFAFYVKMLDQAVASLKHEKPEKSLETRLELQVSAYLPSDYIPVQEQKIDFYQRIYNASSLSILEDIKDELIDRYGPLPQPAETLFKIAVLRIIGANLGVVLMQQHRNVFNLEFSHQVEAFKDQSAGENLKIKAFKMGQENRLRIEMEESIKPEQILDQLIIYLRLAFKGEKIAL